MASFCSGLLGATTGALWPVRNIVLFAVATSPEVAPDTKGSYSGGKLHGIADLRTTIAVQFGQLPKIGLAALCWIYTVDMEAAASGYDLRLTGWMARILFRDLALMLLVPGVWDWILYFSPLKDRMAPYKFNKQYPDAKQFTRDFFWTTSATLLGSVQEVLLMRWWAGGFFERPVFGAKANEESVPWGASNTFFGTPDTAVFALPELPGIGVVYFNEYTTGFLIWTVTMLYWRIAHFYFIHRNMHPWWDRENGLAQGDIGAVLYRYVHSHHHKSYNPTAFSGISMLPIESISYISAALIPLFFRSGCHPWIHLYTKLDLIMGAQIGHDGFDAPGGGSYFHTLHHAHFECNYGDNIVPLDWIFGTFEDGSSKVTATTEGTGMAASLLNDYRKTIFTMQAVAQHASKSDCWVVLDGVVLDVTEFLSEHPGGEQILFSKAGHDITMVFKSIHEKSGGFSLVDMWPTVKKVGMVNEASKPSSEELEGLAVGNESTSTGQYCIAQVAVNAVFLVVCLLSWRLLMGD